LITVIQTVNRVIVNEQPARVIEVVGLGPQGPAGESGPAGDEVELQANATHIQWRYVGGATWTDLVALSEITGPAGATGSPGATGSTGAQGNAATITLGTVGTGAPGSSVIITNSGTSGAAVFNFTIPRGDVGATGAAGATGSTGATGAAGADGKEVELQNTGSFIQWRYVGESWANLVAISAITGPAGATGATGATGSTGAAATIAVGAVSTGAPGSSATVTNVGTSGAAVFDFAIPRGDVGATGSTGATGSQGPAGQGVPVGGTTGQVLAKIDGTDYATEWVDPAAGLSQPQIMARVSVGF